MPAIPNLRFEGALLRAAREARSIRRERLAADTGLSFETIRRYETNSTIPRVDLAVRLADALGIDVRDLLRAA